MFSGKLWNAMGKTYREGSSLLGVSEGFTGEVVFIWKYGDGRVTKRRRTGPHQVCALTEHPMTTESSRMCPCHSNSTGRDPALQCFPSSGFHGTLIHLHCNKPTCGKQLQRRAGQCREEGSTWKDAKAGENIFYLNSWGKSNVTETHITHTYRWNVNHTNGHLRSTCSIPIIWSTY